MRNIASSFFVRSKFAALPVVAGFGVFLALNACGSSSSPSSSTTPGTDAGDEDVGPVKGGANDSGSNEASTVGTVPSVTPTTVTIYPGGTSSLTFSRGSSQDALDLTFSGLPTGVGAQALTLASGAASEQITLTANTTVVAPESANVTVTATSEATGSSSQTSFTLNVVGAPGTLDLTWGVSGIARGAGANGTQATGVGFQKSGAVVIGGFSGQTYAVARYTTAGVLDTAFGTGGITTTTPTGQNSFSNTGGISVDSSDRILLVGGSSDATNGQQGRILRYTATGTLDTAFGASGYTLTGNQTLYGIAAAGTDFVTSGFNLGTLTGALSEVDGTGTLVSAFDTSAVFEPPAPNNTLDIHVFAIGTQASGKIIGCGDVDATCGRFNTNGSVDTTFGTGGFNVTATSKHTLSALAVNTDDSIIAVGSDGGSPQQFFVQKLTKDGVLDNTFGTSGMVATHFGDSSADAYANGVAIQSDGKIVVVGEASAAGRNVMAIARYTKAGAVDPSFGASGVLIVPVATATAMANAVAIQADGRIVVAGHGDMDFAVLRVWP